MVIFSWDPSTDSWHVAKIADSPKTKLKAHTSLLSVHRDDHYEIVHLLFQNILKYLFIFCKHYNIRDKCQDLLWISSFEIESSIKYCKPPAGWSSSGEADKSEDEVEDGGDDDEDGQPARSGQQVEGLVLHGERPNVVP